MGITTEIVTQYTTSDGRKFLDHYKALAREGLIEALTPIKSLIPEIKLKHGTYVEVDKELMFQYRRMLWPLVLNAIKADTEWPEIAKWDVDNVPPRSMIGRILDDHGGPIKDAWSRMSSWDFETGRIFDQPYFAINPSEAKHA